MKDFYERVLGLSCLQVGERGGHGDELLFYRFGESFGNHVAVLALFADNAGGVSMSPDDENGVLAVGRRSSLHHLTPSLSWDKQDDPAAWLRREGCEARFVDFTWTGWRGLFTRDPDGNTVELVAASTEWHIK